MGSQTAKGYPYPLGTDRVMDGDDAIKALAEAVDGKIGVAAMGTFPGGSLASGVVNVAITYPVGRFTAAPTLIGLAVHPDTTVGVLNSSTTGGTLAVQQRTSAGAIITTGTSRTGVWIALQV